MAITIKHAKTDTIADWTQADLDQQIAAGNYPPGTVLADIVLPSDWNNDHTFTGTLPVANGGTGVTSSSGANSVVIRDANANITTNCLFEGYTTQAASGTTIVLTASSVQNFQITGSGGQTIRLPNATTLPNGALFTFNNNQSSGTIVVQNNSSTTVDTLQSGAFSTVVLLDNSTAAGSWDRHNQSPSNVSWSTNTFDYPGSITSATWNGNAIALNRGGTNANLTAVNGGAVYSTGSALAITAAGTSGQVLTSSGAGAPTWTTPTTGTVTSVTGTSPIASSGGTTPAISISQATTSTNGYLSSTDWNTFNGKAPGTTYTTNYIPFGQGTTTLNQSSALQFNGTNLTTTGTVTSTGEITPSVTASTTDLTLSAISTGAVKFNTAGGEQVRIQDGTTSTQYLLLARDSGANTQRISAVGANLGLEATGGGSINIRTAAATETQLQISRTASAVNYVQVTGGTTGSFPVMSAQGSDGTIGLNLYAKGAARINFFNNNGSNRHVSIGGNGTAAVNYIDLNGTTATNAPVISVAGTDTNISMAFQPKGTGAIDLAAGSSGVNISNGGTVTAITRTAAGSNYTSLPTWSASLPTTAGGVQATGTVNNLTAAATPTIVSGGTGYTVGDVLTMTGGTASPFIQVTVSTVSSGVITAVTLTNGGGYTVVPTNPVSVTGGTGTGATFNLNFGVNASFTISNAGSGYIEQPTVTFSGGGGSGAAAYATVGSATTLKSLGNVLNIATSGGVNFAINDASLLNPATYAYATGGATSAGFGVISSAGSAGVTFTSKGTSPVDFYTNGYGSLALRASHTTSAVNYVQVTGGATGVDPNITIQGSDANRGLAIGMKGTGVLSFYSNGVANRQLRIDGSVAAVNSLNIVGSIAGQSPQLGVNGSDTDISMLLVPKGLGIVYTNQQTPVAVDATNTLTIANLLTQIVTTTSATAVSLTLPTGTLTDAGISGGTSAVNTAFEWSSVNLGSAVGAITLVAGTGHTIVGSTAIAVGVSARFKTRKTATNTFITYRIA